MDAERDPYRVLGVDPSADRELIQAAWRVLVKRNHQDRNPSADSARRMVEINAAWAILRDDEARRAWDRDHLASRDTRSGHAPSPQPPPPTWRGGGVSGSSGSSGSSGPVRDGDGSARSSSWGSQGSGAPAGASDRPQWRRGPQGEGAAGPPPGQPVGTVLPFGRHIGWSLGEVARVDAGYLTWLSHRPEGARFKTEIEKILRGEIPTGSGPLGANRPRWGKPG